MGFNESQPRVDAIATTAEAQPPALTELLSRAMREARLNAIVESDDVSPECCWVDLAESRQEVFLVAPEIRHRKHGYKVVRYRPKDNSLAASRSESDWNWDEQYQFYTSVEHLVDAIKNADYKKGRRNF